MRSVLRVFLGLTVLAGTTAALADRPILRSDKVTQVPAQKNVKDISNKIVRITDLRTGKSIRPHGTTRASTVAYDSMTAPAVDPNTGLNLAFQDANGFMLCKYPVSQDAAFFTLIGMAPTGCGAFEAPSSPGLGITDAQDILFDPFIMDPAVADANSLHTLTQIDGTLFTDGSMQGLISIVLGSAETFDYDASGIFELTSGVVITFDFSDPNLGSGLFTFAVPLDPNLGLQTYGRATLLYDYINTFTDPNGAAQTACGVGNAMTGGNPLGLFSADPNCARPNDLMTVGSVEEAFFGPGSDVWIFYNATQGDPNTPSPWDPNFPVDPSVDGDANSVSYTDIWNAGLGIFWVFGDGQTGLDFAATLPARLYVDAGAPCPGDANGDGTVDITDLGLVLQNFGGAGPAGDLNGDGAVDITDLGLVLSNFGVPCP